MTDGVAGKYKTKYQVYEVVGEQQQYASKCNASLLPLIVLARLLSSAVSLVPGPDIYSTYVCVYPENDHLSLTRLLQHSAPQRHYYPDTVCCPTSIALCGIK